MTNLLSIIAISTNLTIGGNSYDPIRAEHVLQLGMLNHSNRIVLLEKQVIELRDECEKVKHVLGSI